MFLVWTLNSIGWWFDNYNADDYLLTDISSICLWSYLNGWRGGITETLVDLIATVYHIYKVYRVFFFLKKKDALSTHFFFKPKALYALRPYNSIN